MPIRVQNFGGGSVAIPSNGSDSGLSSFTGRTAAKKAAEERAVALRQRQIESDAENLRRYEIAQNRLDSNQTYDRGRDATSDARVKRNSDIAYNNSVLQQDSLKQDAANAILDRKVTAGLGSIDITPAETFKGSEEVTRDKTNEEIFADRTQAVTDSLVTNEDANTEAAANVSSLYDAIGPELGPKPGSQILQEVGTTALTAPATLIDKVLSAPSEYNPFVMAADAIGESIYGDGRTLSEWFNGIPAKEKTAEIIPQEKQLLDYEQSVKDRAKRQSNYDIAAKKLETDIGKASTTAKKGVSGTTKENVPVDVPVPVAKYNQSQDKILRKYLKDTQGIEGTELDEAMGLAKQSDWYKNNSTAQTARIKNYNANRSSEKISREKLIASNKAETKKLKQKAEERTQTGIDEVASSVLKSSISQIHKASNRAEDPDNEITTKQKLKEAQIKFENMRAL